MSYTPAQKRAYWANKKRAGNNVPAGEKKPFKRLENPSIYQKAVFDDVDNGNGHTVVEAVAGSGKSTTLLNSLFYVGNRTCCFVAFGKDIAEELKARNPVPGIDIGTCHSFGYRSVRARFPKIRLDKDKLPNLIERYLGSPKTDDGYDAVKAEYNNQVKKCIELCKQWLVSDDDGISDIIDQYGIEFVPGLGDSGRKIDLTNSGYDKFRKQFITECQHLLKLCQQLDSDGNMESMDFSDMIWLPNVLNLPMQRYDVVFIDEIQDYCRTMMELIPRMLNPGGRFIACGDRRQAIFAFRGADSESIPNLIKRFDAKTLPLSISYRCAKNIIQFAKDMVSGLDHLEASPTAPDGIVNQDVSVKKMMENCGPGDFILSRTNAPLIRIAMRLLRQKKACNILGRDIGGNFRAFVRASKAKSLPKFMEYLSNWREKQLELIEKKPKKQQDNARDMIEDKVDCLTALAMGCTSIQELLDSIENMFSDDKSENIIMLSNCHKAKGAERNRTWLLGNTFRPGENVDEDNVLYVGITRGKTEVNWVTGSLKNLDSDDPM